MGSGLVGLVGHVGHVGHVGFGDQQVLIKNILVSTTCTPSQICTHLSHQPQPTIIRSLINSKTAPHATGCSPA
jgi:hypothetical protein